MIIDVPISNIISELFETKLQVFEICFQMIEV